MKMFLANKLLLEKVSPMLLIKFDFQLLREAATSFNIKPHQKHFFFYIIPQNMQISKLSPHTYLIFVTLILPTLLSTTHQFLTAIPNRA